MIWNRILEVNSVFQTPCAVILEFPNIEFVSTIVVRILVTRALEYPEMPLEHPKGHWISRQKVDGWVDIVASFCIIERIELDKAFDHRIMFIYIDPMQHPITNNNTSIQRSHSEGIQSPLWRNNRAAPFTGFRRKYLHT